MNEFEKNGPYIVTVEDEVPEVTETFNGTHYITSWRNENSPGGTSRLYARKPGMFIFVKNQPAKQQRDNTVIENGE